MQMKKTQGPSLHQLSQRKRNTGLQDSGAGNDKENYNLKNHTALTYFKSAVKKCAGVFTLFLPGKRKVPSKVVESDERRNTHKDERRNTHKVRELSCKSDE